LAARRKGCLTWNMGKAGVGSDAARWRLRRHEEAARQWHGVRLCAARFMG
jgi:hypothetical protein